MKRSMLFTAAGLTSLALAGALTVFNLSTRNTAAGSSAQAAPTVRPAAAAAVEVVKDPTDLPAPIIRTAPERVAVRIVTKELAGFLGDGTTYTYWTFNGTVPGPLLRVRVGDTVDLTLANDKSSANPHSIDLHAVTGPGGGAVATQVKPGEEKTFTFKAMNPGVFVYHCATPHIPTHIAHGMYGLIVVEPQEGLARADREFYIMQGDMYTAQPYGTKGDLSYDPMRTQDERPTYVVFNGKAAGLTEAHAMHAKVGETVRLFVGNGGPNLISNFHVIGEIMDTVHEEAASEAVHNVQTTVIPAGGAAWIEFKVDVPGTYILVDHALSRVFDKGAVAKLVVEGQADKSIFDAHGAMNMTGH